jgi:hypothetical protein
METINMHTPLENNINFQKHFEEYYFGEGSHPYLPKMLTSYLENRVKVKKLCEEA